MVLAGLLFTFWRVVELVTLIPLIGMLSWFVHGFVQDNALTPNFILVLFIVSVLAGVWALATLLFYYSAKRSGYFLAFVDLGIFAALIAGVVELRGIAGASCSNFSSTGYFGLRLAPFIYQLNKSCSVLKACFAFGIMNIIFFFFTFSPLTKIMTDTRTAGESSLQEESWRTFIIKRKALFTPQPPKKWEQECRQSFAQSRSLRRS
ncbi:MAG: hypothetical protein M1828_002495 [Chrysothrix sp. TS-e1954]|nr:MAG: hypothetical protein M1828_002495 [Chrysothrix sp. TS-e1954]